MEKSKVREYFDEFLKSYDVQGKDLIWKNHSNAFKEFWFSKVAATSHSDLNEDEIDSIIRILDRNGKGNTKSSEAVAKALIPQGAWRRMFNELHSNQALSKAITNIFQETDLALKSKNIDTLYQLNLGKKNNLTGQSGNAINAMLTAYDPFMNSSIISLKDRKSLIDYMGFPWTFNFEKETVGLRIVKTNEMILSGFANLGLAGSARTLSYFCYITPFKTLWKGEHTIITPGDTTVTVTVPTDQESDETEGPKVSPHEEERESIQVQALLADIGSRMGMKIWLPKSDRSRVLKYWKNPEEVLLNSLPLNYDDTTLKTIEQIDVLWLHGRSIVRAFEVEHTTSVYSGILRMADLLALQPNMAIKLHIVAPVSKREKVFQEIRRPVFALLERGPLAKTCSYLSYDSLRDLASEKHLEHLSDKVLDEYAEEVEESND